MGCIWDSLEISLLSLDRQQRLTKNLQSTVCLSGFCVHMSMDHLSLLCCSKYWGPLIGQLTPVLASDWLRRIMVHSPVVTRSLATYCGNGTDVHFVTKIITNIYNVAWVHPLDKTVSHRCIFTSETFTFASSFYLYLAMIPFRHILNKTKHF